MQVAYRDTPSRLIAFVLVIATGSVLVAGQSMVAGRTTASTRSPGGGGRMDVAATEDDVNSVVSMTRPGVQTAEDVDDTLGRRYKGYYKTTKQTHHNKKYKKIIKTSPKKECKALSEDCYTNYDCCDTLSCQAVNGQMKCLRDCIAPAPESCCKSDHDCCTSRGQEVTCGSALFPDRDNTCCIPVGEPQLVDSDADACCSGAQDVRYFHGGTQPFCCSPPTGKCIEDEDCCSNSTAYECSGSESTCCASERTSGAFCETEAALMCCSQTQCYGNALECCRPVEKTTENNCADTPDPKCCSNARCNFGDDNMDEDKGNCCLPARDSAIGACDPTPEPDCCSGNKCYGSDECCRPVEKTSAFNCADTPDAECCSTARCDFGDDNVASGDAGKCCLPARASGDVCTPAFNATDSSENDMCCSGVRCVETDACCRPVEKTSFLNCGVPEVDSECCSTARCNSGNDNELSGDAGKCCLDTTKGFPEPCTPMKNPQCCSGNQCNSGDMDCCKPIEKVTDGFCLTTPDEAEECCTGLRCSFNTNNDQSDKGKCCVQPFGICNNDFECCGGTCTDGNTCCRSPEKVTDFSCVTTPEPECCTEFRCNGDSGNDQSDKGKCCVPTSAAAGVCNNNSECCSGTCFGFRCVLD